MPQIDMPLEQLFAYGGRNPRPADFDEFWATALRELDDTPPAAQFTPAEWQVPNFECNDVWFDGVRGGRIYAKHVQPANTPTPLPAILVFHGYTCDSEQWSFLLGLAAAGFAVYAMDCRGQAGKSYDQLAYKGRTHHGLICHGIHDDDPQHLAVRHLMLDAAQMARIALASPCVDENRVAAYGQSQGGALTLACAALEPRITVAVSVFPWLCDYQRTYEMQVGGAVSAEEITYWLRTNDPQHLNINALFLKLGYIDTQHLASRIRARTLMMTGLCDNGVPPSSQFAAYNKITAPKQVRVFPDFAHETLRGQTDIAIQFLMQWTAK